MERVTSDMCLAESSADIYLLCAEQKELPIQRAVFSARIAEKNYLLLVGLRHDSSANVRLTRRRYKDFSSPFEWTIYLDGFTLSACLKQECGNERTLIFWMNLARINDFGAILVNS